MTAGNGAIYATRRDSYIVVDPIMGHDLSFPFNMVKRGWRAVDVPTARATEKMVPSIEGEWRRKRRMMSHTWPIVVRGGMLSPKGYTSGYALMMVSHRLLRYLTPFLHLLALARKCRACGGKRGSGVHGDARAAARTARRRRARRGGACADAVDRPLLRTHRGVPSSRTVGLAAPRHRGLVAGRGGNPVIRRAVDVVVGGLALVVATPIVAAAMLAIRAESRGHPIYKQRRVGKDGREFDVLKLRTMVDGAEHIGAGLAVNENDSARDARGGGSAQDLAR